MIVYDKEPLEGVPMVEVVDEKGKVVREGYYFCFPESCPYPVCNGTQSVEMVEGVVVCEYGDWGLPNSLKLVRVTPPHSVRLKPERLPNGRGTFGKETALREQGKGADGLGR